MPLWMSARYRNTNLASSNNTVVLSDYELIETKLQLTASYNNKQNDAQSPEAYGTSFCHPLLV
jgi:hypothetical protein